MPRRARDNASREHEHDRLLRDAVVTLETAARVVRYQDRIERAVFRRRLRLSQAAFAREIGLDLRAVRGWERHSERPADPVARAFLAKLRDEMGSNAAAERRLTVESALRATFQRYERSDGNPLHAWQAVWMCTHPEGDLVSLPRWCADYLYRAADALLALPEVLALTKRRDPSQSDTARQVSRALGLTRQGWSAFEKLIGDEDKILRKREFDKSQLEGASSEASIVAASKYRPEISKDGAKKAVQGGKRLLTYHPHNPQVSRSGVKGKGRL